MLLDPLIWLRFRKEWDCLLTLKLAFDHLDGVPSSFIPSLSLRDWRVAACKVLIQGVHYICRPQ